MNPYESPNAVATVSPSLQEIVDDSYHHIGRVVVLWEKLRYLYVVILLVVILLAAMLRPNGSMNHLLWSEIILGLLAANAVYCLGPLVDGYLNWFGIRVRWLTLALFVVGTALATMIAFIETFLWGGFPK